MFEISVEHHFAAAHKLVNYKGKCSQLHGHNWRVVVYARSNTLDSIGISLDFKKFKQIVREEIDELDHKYLNEYPSFKKINPTAENISMTLFNILKDRINNKNVKIHMVEVWESEKQACRYFED